MNSQQAAGSDSRLEGGAAAETRVAMRSWLALVLALARAREARTQNGRIQEGRNLLFMMVDDGGFE